MHSYLRAIGFSESFSSEYDIELFLDDIFHTYDQRKAVRLESGDRAFIEMSKSFGPEIGIRVCGEFDNQGFHRQFYFPYLNGNGVTTEADMNIENRVSGNGYTGVCEDGRIGVSLIFYVSNPVDFCKAKIGGRLAANRITNTMSALSVSGMILLPIQQNQNKNEERQNYFAKRNSMVIAAKNGNTEAIENLTLDDMDIYTMLSRRVGREDVFTIVDTFFMPYGMECDQYQILGIINFYTKVQNSVTKERVYQMNVECNGMVFDVCINERDLVGEPEAGRRFKGVIWLQGRINFE